MLQQDYYSLTMTRTPYTILRFSNSTKLYMSMSSQSQAPMSATANDAEISDLLCFSEELLNTGRFLPYKKTAQENAAMGNPIRIFFVEKNMQIQIREVGLQHPHPHAERISQIAFNQPKLLHTFTETPFECFHSSHHHQW